MHSRRILRPLILAAAVSALACGSSSSAPPPSPTDYLIVSADSLAGSAARWRDFRKADHKVELGLVSEIVGTKTVQADANAAIRDWIKTRWAARDPKKPFYVLLVGDANADKVSTDTVPVAKVTSSTGTVVTDNVYADMTDDGIPDLALGRIPADSDAVVDQIRAKVVTYETSYVVGPAARRLNLFASTSGFGEPADTLIETLVFKVVEEIPYEYDITMTYAKQDSPYVFVPERFSDKVYERINEGALMVTYVGHGYQEGFADLKWGSKSYPILDTDHLEKLAGGARPTMLTLIACATGAFATGDSVSERVLRSATGPVAVLSSTENSHPYPNAIFVRELSQVLAASRVATIGEAFRTAKDRMIHEDDALRKTIDNAVSSQVGPAEQVSLKRSHLDMYTLFGDPAMRITYPGTGLTLTAPASVAPGGSLAVAVSVPALASGKVHVTFESLRSDIYPMSAIKPVPADGDPARDATIEANYGVANTKVTASADAQLAAGKASVNLAVPADLPPGDYRVKAYADDGTHDAVAVATVHVGP